MLKKITLLSLLFCLSVLADAQTSESLKLRERETLFYEKDKIDFRYENDIAVKDALALDKKLRALSRDIIPTIYKAPGADASLYLVTVFNAKKGDEERMMLYRKSGDVLTALYKSPPFRNYYNLGLKIFEGENRSLILAEKREGVGDYIDTEVFELAGGRVKYLGNIPVGLIEETTGNIDSFAGRTEISYQAGNYRIKILGKSYLPAGARNRRKDGLVGSNVTYIYDGKRLRKGK